MYFKKINVTYPLVQMVNVSTIEGRKTVFVARYNLFCVPILVMSDYVKYPESSVA